MPSFTIGRTASRMLPLASMTVALLAGVRAGHAAAPGDAAAWRARSHAAAGAVAELLHSLRLFANPGSIARREVDALRGSRPREAALLDRIASQPSAHWIGGWARDPRGEVNRIASTAAASGTVPVFVAYNIPDRDCGAHSAGGARNGSGYGRWIRDFAAGLTGRGEIVVLEPDAVVKMDCLDPGGQEERLAMLRDAVGVLKASGARVYLDAGNARWMKPAALADRLRRASIDRADGFALNVANFIPTAENVRYGEQLSALVGGKHFVIDTGRNGAGGNGEWCNPRGQALGAAPTTSTGHRLVDAYLWIKQPGESDGHCNGGPDAGRWWTEYALELARNGLQVAAR